ncbi:hypothetical protein Mmah_0099 [Methanohalophilus mahii DSM 5219]|uniref:HTH arsR-type domain-containing protein n=1 Tax=Methanohalophilus mahii (strain ATCC 35705 / DSM 5219 / SLP) TaxID=547558 RepID=D5E8X6_METMS|nr:hypothetical protein Mmah_0099 [Methanohalophilus mahii DSM 5219]
MLNLTTIEIFKHLTHPKTVSEISTLLKLDHSTISKSINSLVESGLVVRRKQGRYTYVTRSESLHSRSLKDILIEYPRLPLNNILTSSALTILAVLNNSCSISDIATKTGLNRKTVAYTIGQLAKYGIVLQENKKYFFSKRHSLIRSFVDNYWKYRTNKTLKEISPNAVLLWQRGPEILFKIDNDFIDSDKPVKKESIHPTAMNIFPKYGLKVISDLGYYFYSKRDLKAEDYVIHTLLIDPYSPIYNSYALALYSKTGSTELVKFGKLYDMEDHTKTLQEYLRIKEKNSSFLLPWNEFIDLIKDIQ